MRKEKISISIDKSLLQSLEEDLITEKGPVSRSARIEILIKKGLKLEQKEGMSTVARPLARA